MASADERAPGRRDAARTRARGGVHRPRRLRGRERGGHRSAPASACPTGCSASRSAPSPAASGAGSSWPGSCSPAPQTLLLDEPTNHLDADSIVWLRDVPARPGRGGLIVISHDAGLLEATVNKVCHLDANRASSTSTTSAGRPTWSSARPTSGAASGSGPTPRRRPPRCSPRPTRCGPRPPRPAPRRTWPGGPSGCWPGWSDAAQGRQGGQGCGSRARRRAARPR